jgi:hypothetical protein
MLQCFIVQRICAPSTNFAESKDKSEEKESENTILSNKKECWIEKEVTQFKKLAHSFSMSTFYDIFLETLCNNVNNNKIFKKYRKTFWIGPKTFILLRESEGLWDKKFFYTITA